jgi:hypothetical protein
MQTSLSIARESSEVTKASVTLGREEFFATHRPKLVVRRVEFIVEKGNLPVGIRYMIYNVGDSEGTITAISERLSLDHPGDQLHFIKPYRKPKELSITLASGGHTVSEHIHPDGEELGFQSVAFLQLGAQDRKPQFLGYIEYVDRLGITRRTGFLREYDPPTRCFVAVQNADYEHAD